MRRSLLLPLACLTIPCELGCASIAELRTETVLKREVKASEPARESRYDGPRVQALVKGSQVEARVEWVTVCSFADLESYHVRLTTNRKMNLEVPVVEVTAMALGTALALSSMSKDHACDPHQYHGCGTGESLQIAVGMLIAAPAAIALTVDVFRSRDSEEEVVRSVRQPEKYYACDTRPMPDAPVLLRFADGRSATGRTDARGGAMIDLPATLAQQAKVAVEVSVDGSPAMRGVLSRSGAPTEFW